VTQRAVFLPIDEIVAAFRPHRGSAAVLRLVANGLRRVNAKSHSYRITGCEGADL